MLGLHRSQEAAIVAMLACLVPPTASRGVAAPLGGQDVEVAHLLDSVGTGGDPHLAIAADGTAFCVLDFYDANLNQGQILTYRSVNGGKTWSAWGTPLVAASAGTIDAEILPGSPEQLLVARAYGAAVYPYFNNVLVYRAEIDDAAPAWQYDGVESPLPPAVPSSPHLSVIEDPVGSPAQVAVIWKWSSPPAVEVHYALSTDGGVSFSTPITLSSAPLGGKYETDVAMDAGGVVHAAWTYLDAATQTGLFQYRRATGGGDASSDWSNPVLLDNVDFGAASAVVSMAASPVSDGVIVALGEDGVQDTTDLYISTDAALTWPNPKKTFAGKRYPEAVWGDTGPAFGAIEPTGGDHFVIVRPLVNLLDLWTSHDMLVGESFIPYYGGSPAADPSRGGLLAMVALMPNLQDVGASPWFDAEWRADPGFGVPEFEPGFDIGGGTITSALGITDLDGDGDDEVVFTASSPDRVARFDLESMTATTLKNVAVTSASSAPAMIDIDGEGTNEVFVGVGNGKVVGVHHDGTYVTGYPVDTASGAAPWVSCGQVTGTANAEVVAATVRSIFVYGPTGIVAPGFPYVAAAARGNAVGRVAIGDVDADGELELVAAFQHGALVLSRLGTLEKAMLLAGPDLSAGVSLADLDGDGDLEIAVPRANGSVALVHHDGSTFGAAWPWSSGTGQPIGSVAIADFFGGSDKDLVFAALTGEAFAVDLSGAQPSGWAFAVGAHVEDAPEPVLSGLGTFGKQIALGDVAGTGYVRGPLGPQAGWPRDFYGAIEHAPAATDLDQDGSVELVIPADDRLWILDLQTSDGPFGTNWPMAGARFTRSGCRECGTFPATGAGDSPAARQATALHPGEPNPFSHATLLRYDVAAGGAPVRVDVYDVAGRLVRALVDAPQAGGAHAVQWNGRDSAGRVVAAGVYLVRLSAGAETSTERVVRIQ
jgi:hypothetical protein